VYRVKPEGGRRCQIRGSIEIMPLKAEEMNIGPPKSGQASAKGAFTWHKNHHPW